MGVPESANDLVELIDAVDGKHDAAHKRIRSSLATLGEESRDSIEALRDKMNGLSDRVVKLENAPPPDVMKLRFPMAVVVTIVIATSAVVGAGYGFSSMVTGRIDAIAKSMDERAAATTKLLDERARAQKDAMDALSRQMELLKYEQQRLREDVTNKKSGSSR